MSLQDRLSALITALGADIKLLLGGGAYTPVEVTASRSITVDDLGKTLVVASSSPVVLTFGAGIGAGRWVNVIRAGTGTVQLVADTGYTSTPVGPTLRAVGSAASAIMLAGTAWSFVGDFPGTAGSGGSLIGTRVVTGTTDIPTDDDRDLIIRYQNDTGTAVTVNAGDFVANDTYHVLAEGDGDVTLTAGAGQTFIPTGTKTLPTGKAASLVYLGANTWLVVGGFAESGGGADPVTTFANGMIWSMGA